MHAAIPANDAVPTTIVIAISVGKKWPDTMCAHPRRYSQMNVIIASQKIRHGNAAHFAVSLLCTPAMIGNHNGNV